MGWCFDGLTRARASGAPRHVLKEPKRTRSEMRDPSRTSKKLCAKTAPLSEIVKLKDNTFDAALCSCTSSKLKETGYLKVDRETGSLELMGSGLDSISCLRLNPVGVTTYTESGDPPNAVPACCTSSKWSETVNLKVNILQQSAQF